MDPLISLVIPCLNEERRLPPTLRELDGWVSVRRGPVEVWVVDNGSCDGTLSLARAAAAAHPYLRVLREPLRGKGAAVRRGMMAASGDVRVFLDADLSVPLADLEPLLDAVAGGVDIAIASRELPGAVRVGEPALRHWLGRAFNLYVRAMVLPGIRDSQFGLKAFSGSAADDLFPCLTTAGFAFDVELLAQARRRGWGIAEVPVPWRFDADSRVRPLPDALRMGMQVMAVRRRLGR